MQEAEGLLQTNEHIELVSGRQRPHADPSIHLDKVSDRLFWLQP